MKDATLGIGISLKKSPTTQELKHVNPTLDLLSIRALLKKKVSKSASQEKFTHWLPLYFGESETHKVVRRWYNYELGEHATEVRDIKPRERFEKHFFNSLAIIESGTAKGPPASPGLLLEFFPRLIMTHITALAKGDRGLSLVAVRRLFNFIRVFHYALEKNPEIRQKIDKRLQDFISDPKNRLKNPEICPNLGDILIYCLMSQSYSFEDVKMAY